MKTIPTPGEHAIQAALEQLSRDDMQALIQRMVHQHPDLAELIVSKQPTAIKKPREPFNAEVYRLQVEKIFYTTDRNTWGSEARAAGPLLDIVDISDEYVEQQGFSDAASLYEIIIRGILYNYDSFRWHADEGQLDDVVEDYDDIEVLLLGLQGDTIDDETFLRLCRETESYNYLVERLLKLRRLEEALTEAKQVENYDILEIVDILCEHGHEAAAERLIEERVKEYDDTYLLEWLKERYQARGNVTGALEMASRMFRAYPLAATIERYREIRQLAQQLGRWEIVQSEAMAYVKQSRDIALQIEIALDEGQVELALALLLAQKQTENSRGGPYGADNFNVGIEVAKAVEESHPPEAIDIYQAYVETYIEWRGRENYHIACQYLTSVRRLYQKIDKSNEWTAYIADLRERNARLPALKDEMAKAKL